VFAASNRDAIHPDVFSQTFKPDRRQRWRSGLPRLRLHDLRHTHASLMLKESAPIKVVSKRSAQPTPGFTMATCRHYNDEGPGR
jgi:integrase